jgi:hypothetical protein
MTRCDAVAIFTALGVHDASRASPGHRWTRTPCAASDRISNVSRKQKRRRGIQKGGNPHMQNTPRLMMLDTCGYDRRDTRR